MAGILRSAALPVLITGLVLTVTAAKANPSSSIPLSPIPLDPVEVMVEREAPVPTGPAATERAGEPATFSLQDDILRLIQSTGWASSEWGVLAISLESGDTLAAMDADRALAPASNQKLFTTAAALHHLGPEYRFPTFLLTDGRVDDGVLSGDLVLYGTGDPAISDRLLDSPTDPLEAFARSLVRAGVHTVSGDVVGGGTFYEGPTRHASWNARDLDNWYAAPVSALTFGENVVTLQIRAGAPGTAAQLRTAPEAAALPLINEGRSVGGGSRAALHVLRDDPDDPIRIVGNLPTGSPEVWRVITVSDPSAYAASVFRAVLEAEGIEVTGEARSLRPGETSGVTGSGTVAPAFRGDGERAVSTLAVHHSPPVRELLDVVNKRSHNLFAELLLFAVGKMTTGTGSFEGGSAALEDYLVRVVGIPEGDLRVEDGSGLSALNRATPSSFVQLLSHVASTDHAEVFWSSLPEAGNRLELGRMYRSAAASNLRAKTGTIERVSALSGVVRAANGEPVLFSILSNNVPSSGTAKRVEDDIGIALASFTRPWAPGELARVEYGTYGPRLVPGSDVDAATAR